MALRRVPREEMFAHEQKWLDAVADGRGGDLTQPRGPIRKMNVWRKRASSSPASANTAPSTMA